MDLIFFSRFRDFEGFTEKKWVAFRLRASLSVMEKEKRLTVFFY